MADTFHRPKPKTPTAPESSANEANASNASGALTSAELRGVFRSHLVKFGALIGLVFIVSLFLVRPFFSFTRDNVSIARICDCAHGHGQDLFYLTDFFGSAFRIGLNIVVAAGLLLFYFQVVAFSSPHMTRTERRYAYGSLPFVLLCFIVGAALTFYVALPRMLELLENFQITTYNFTVYIHVPLLIGSVFELLIIMYMLARLGIVSSSRMSANRPGAFILALLAATLFTTFPLRLDMLILVTAVIYALYEVGIMLAKIAERRRDRTSVLEDGGLPRARDKPLDLAAAATPPRFP